MTRSRRKNPIRAWTCADSEKQDKQMASRKLRRIVRQLLHVGERLLPKKREVSNPYRWAKDGKQIFDPEEEPRLMRK